MNNLPFSFLYKVRRMASNYAYCNMCPYVVFLYHQEMLKASDMEGSIMFVTITHSNGIFFRPAREDDVEGKQSKRNGGGTLAFHSSRETAYGAMDSFWEKRGYKDKIVR